MHTKSGRRGGLSASVVAGVLLLLPLAGCGTPDGGAAPAASSSAAPSASSSAAASQPAATVAPSPAGTGPAPAGSSAPAAPAGVVLPVLARSEPVTLEVPSIGLRTDLLSLGLRANGSLEVPQDVGDGAPASWYNGSPTPGERGPSIYLGHVNALGGHKGVFADLRQLAAGAEINALRADGSTATFVVDRAAQYSKNDFPTFDVYGNTEGSELRLITCDGYDPATGLFDDNYVVYAKLKA